MYYINCYKDQVILMYENTKKLINFNLNINTENYTESLYNCQVCDKTLETDTNSTKRTLLQSWMEKSESVMYKEILRFFGKLYFYEK